PSFASIAWESALTVPRNIARVSAYLVNEYRANSNGTMNRTEAHRPTFVATSAISQPRKTSAMVPKSVLLTLSAQILAMGELVRRLAAATARNMFVTLNPSPTNTISATVPNASSALSKGWAKLKINHAAKAAKT